MLKRLLTLGLVLVFALGPVTAVEPTNLSTVKQQVGLYVASGEYGREVVRVAAEANKYLTRRIPRGIPKYNKTARKLAVVFDIDETTLSNVRHIQANDYGYLPKIWDAWVAQGQGTAIHPVQAVYLTAINAQVDVFFITGRTPESAAATERNLRQVGYEKWTGIHYKPADWDQSTRGFKTETRRQLVASGYLIIANIGDQNSDLVGGHAERTFKLPNPFYIVN